MKKILKRINNKFKFKFKIKIIKLMKLMIIKKKLFKKDKKNKN